jgi:hypothetical protein
MLLAGLIRYGLPRRSKALLLRQVDFRTHTASDLEHTRLHILCQKPEVVIHSFPRLCLSIPYLLPNTLNTWINNALQRYEDNHNA